MGRIDEKSRSENEARYKNMEGQRDRDRDTDLQTGEGRETKAQDYKTIINEEEMRGWSALRTEGNRGGERQKGERQRIHACLSPPNRGSRGRDVEEAGLPLPSEVSLSVPVSLCLPKLRSRETSWEHSEVSVSLKFMVCL